MTKIPSGEVILRAIHGRSASDGNGCDIESNAGDFSIGYQNNIGDSVRIDQANEEGTLSNGQTDIGVAPVQVAANSLDSSRWILSSNTPKDISLDQLAYSEDLQKKCTENPGQDAPTPDTAVERGDLSAGQFSGDTSWALFTN